MNPDDDKGDGILSSFFQTVLPDTALKSIGKDGLGNLDVYFLFHAVHAPNTDLLKQLLARGVDPNVTDWDNRTALHIAAAEANMEAIQILVLEGNAHVNNVDRFGNTPLNDALRCRHSEIVQFLRSNGAKTLGGLEMTSQLMKCAGQGDLETLTALLESGVDVNAGHAYNDHRTPLHVAVCGGHVEAVRLLLHAGADPNSQDRWGATPMDEAKRASHQTIIAVLKEFGAEEGSSNDNGAHDETQAVQKLCKAAGVGDLKALHDLITKRFVDVNCQHPLYGYRTALHFAAAQGQVEATTLLLSKGAKVNCVDQMGNTPMSDAIRMAHDDVAELLKQHGGIMLSTKEELATQLCTAAADDNLAMLKRLVRAGADVRISDYDGRTALHLSSSVGNVDCVTFLLKSGACPNQPDNFGCTAVADAQRHNHHEVVKLLMQSSKPATAILPPPDFQGWLKKRDSGTLLKSWGRRWFELRGRHLYVFRSLQERPLLVIDLAMARIEECRLAKYAFQINTRSVAYQLQASGDDEKTLWWQALQWSINRSNDKYPTTPDVPVHDDVTREDFEVLSTLGRGNFCKVVKARFRRTGEVFAVKVLRKDMIIKQRLVEATISEKEVLQKVQHPFVVTLHYAFQTDAKLYLVLDFLSGGTLIYHLKRAKTFEESRARFYAAEIVMALDYLHSMSVIYRDLKAENVVIDRDGHAVVTDFGLAKSLRLSQHTGTFCGTPEYLAPEVVRHEQYTQSVDWWCLGILLYQMLVGRDPFRAKNAASTDGLYEEIVTKELNYPSNISPEAVDLMRRLLVKDKDKRLSVGAQVMRHPWFASVDWERMLAKQVPVPFKPDLTGDDVKYFKPELRNMQADEGSIIEEQRVLGERRQAELQAKLAECYPGPGHNPYSGPDHMSADMDDGDWEETSSEVFTTTPSATDYLGSGDVLGSSERYSPAMLDRQLSSGLRSAERADRFEGTSFTAPGVVNKAV